MTRDPQFSQLSQREISVLKDLIREYVRSGKPVGSKRLSRINREKVSSATLRNVMSSLESKGYLIQPHTSAGRIPSPEGYRFYVQTLLGGKSLSGEEIGEIQKRLGGENDPSELMNEASQVLSVLSNNLGIVLSPPMSRVKMKHIEFLKLSEGRALVILVNTAGLVRNRIVYKLPNLTQRELNHASRYLVHHFSGMTLVEIRSRLIQLMAEEKALYDNLLRNAAVLGSAALQSDKGESEDDSQVFLGSTSPLVQRLDGIDVDLMALLLETLEEKSRLVTIISECLTAADENPVVTIGLEHHFPGMGSWTLISSPYTVDQGTSGSLAVLGPSRMEYEHTIGLVDYMAKLFGQLLRQN